MRNGIRRRVALLVAAAAVLALMASAHPAPAKPAPLVVVNASTTLVVTPLGPDTAMYSGLLTTRTDPRKAKSKKGRKKLRRQEERAEKGCLNLRFVLILHKGFQIATAFTDANGVWSATGPRPPTGDRVEAAVTSAVIGGLARCFQTTEVTTAP